MLIYILINKVYLYCNEILFMILIFLKINYFINYTFYLLINLTKLILILHNNCHSIKSKNEVGSNY